MPVPSSGRATKARKSDVGIVSALPELRRVSPDERELQGALETRGLVARRVAWDATKVDWSNFRLLVVRSTWNYVQQRERFLRWAERAHHVSALWNPLRTLRWNTEKTYLQDLERAGVAVIPTRWVRADEALDLASIRRATRWGRLVVKPTVSAGGWRTYLVGSGDEARIERRVLRSRPRVDLMVQPYLRSVETVGEIALIFLDGKFSHAIRKEPFLSASRVSFVPPRAYPNGRQKALGRAVLRAVPDRTLYARVDLLRDDDGRWCVGEAELTEPYLYLTTRPGAVEALAAAIERRLDSAVKENTTKPST
ncbi:MAG: hypothetical protein KGI89_10735 [Euryarchaeota archaeon]|nr:hypothetical protein [Euryarchaeota archaeon]